MATDPTSRQRDTIRFVLDGEVHELRDVDPTRTVLQYLREDLRRTGTKEGCAEGDCGACTVVLAELNDAGEDLDVRAVNACIQFLPTLDGKELITVESLADGELHPVQRAMVDEHASQCGFCTPGFVMSLFALYKTNPDPTRVEIDDALAGNLCRCTGYRPIVSAARSMYSQSGGDWLRQSVSDQQPPRDRIERLKTIVGDGMLSFDADGRTFVAPTTIDELCEVLAENPNATLLAGGTDIGLWVTKHHADLECVIYVGDVAGLSGVSVDDGHVVIGAAVTLSDAMPVLLEHFPALEEMFLRYASPPIRNAATIGGNVANGSPIGDSMPALMVLGATLTLRSHRGRRDVPIAEFYHDYMVNDLQEGEFLESIRVPLASADDRLRVYKISKRFDQDISALCGAFRVRIADGLVSEAAIAFGGMAATVKPAANAEQALTGKSWTLETVETAMRELDKDFEPISDMRATADYRKRVAKNLLRRFYLETNGDAVQSVYEYGRQV